MTSNFRVSMNSIRLSSIGIGIFESLLANRHPPLLVSQIFVAPICGVFSETGT